eukprot:750240-Lingulodinium_polyedra.AAC.1
MPPCVGPARADALDAPYCVQRGGRQREMPQLGAQGATQTPECPGPAGALMPGPGIPATDLPATQH